LRLLSIAIALSLPLLSGCWSAEITRGDLAKKGIRFEEAPAPITVSVAGFKNLRGGGDPSSDNLAYAVSRSFLTVLDETRLFQGVYTEAEAPDSEVRFEGSIGKVSIYQNNWWIALWVVTGCATFGLFPGIGALLGLPYASESGRIDLEVRAIERRSGSVVATYETEWSDSWYLNVYNSGDHSKESFYLEPKRAMQAAMNETVERIKGDIGRYRAIEKAKPPEGSGAAPPPGGAPAPEGGGAPPPPR
jgi:hypothetical protein